MMQDPSKVPSYSVSNASVVDVPALHRLGKAFHAAAQLERFAAWDLESFDLTVSSLLMGEVPGALLVVRDGSGLAHGMAGMVLFPLYFNRNVMVIQELFIFVEEEWRFGAGQALIRRLEEIGRGAGASLAMIGALSGLRDGAVAKLYSRAGYTPMEHSFVKRLDTESVESSTMEG